MDLQYQTPAKMMSIAKLIAINTLRSIFCLGLIVFSTRWRGVDAELANCLSRCLQPVKRCSEPFHGENRRLWFEHNVGS